MNGLSPVYCSGKNMDSIETNTTYQLSVHMDAQDMASFIPFIMYVPVIASAIKHHNRECLLKTVRTGDARDKSMIISDGAQYFASSFIILIMRITGSDNEVDTLHYLSAGAIMINL